MAVLVITTLIVLIVSHFCFTLNLRKSRLLITYHKSKEWNDVDIELLRYNEFDKLRKKLKKLLFENNISSRRGWVRVFERWQQYGKMYDNLNKQLYNKSNVIDPLIPSMDSINNKNVLNLLINELYQLEDIDSHDIARSIACNFSDSVSNSIININKSIEKLRYIPERRLGNISIKVKIDYHQSSRKWIRKSEINEVNVNVTTALSQSKPQSLLQLSYNSSVADSIDINSIYFNVLYQKWKRFKYNCNSVNADVSNGDCMDKGEELFLSDLFCVLLRYQALEGYGYQAAVPVKVMECLHDLFGVTGELFASPFNCYATRSLANAINNTSSYAGSDGRSIRYFSLFDIDRAFGSLGSFWDWEADSSSMLPDTITTTATNRNSSSNDNSNNNNSNSSSNNKIDKNFSSFEANPPFTSIIITNMINKMNSVLDSYRNSTTPISFIVIIPAWIDEHEYQTVLNSPYQKGYIIINASDHTYMDGSMYRKHYNSSNNNHIISPFDTAVFLIQNDAGNRKWPLTSNTEAKLRQAFAAGCVHYSDAVRYKSRYIPKKKR